VSEEWRDSEAQVIQRGRWVRLNGTDAEILIPHRGGAAGGAGGNVSFGSIGAAGGGSAAPASSSGSGGQGPVFAGGGGGVATSDLVIRVRRVGGSGQG
jgi:hypothetical protein